MAAIKSYTDLSQSKRLAEILPHESADMVYFGIHQGMDGKYYLSGTNTEEDVVPVYKKLCTKVFAKTTASDVINQLPCWSLAALLDIIPEYIRFNEHTWEFFLDHCGMYYMNADTYDTNTFSSGIGILIDDAFEIILKLHELNLL